MKKVLLLSLVLISFLGSSWAEKEKPVILVGSKNFPENYILAEIASRVIQNSSDVLVQKNLGLGGTGIAFQALVNGEIHLYPEYTGTLQKAVYKLNDPKELAGRLSKDDLVMSRPLGFNNTYAIAVKKDFAKKNNLEKIGDLKRVPALRAGFSYEFMEREDGASALMDFYGLDLKVSTIEHSLAYEALSSGKVDLIDAYSTDAKIGKMELVLLSDDGDFFPRYEAVFVARKDFTEEFPAAWEALNRLEGTLTNELMSHLNGLVENKGKTFKEAAEIYMGSIKWLRLFEKRNMRVEPPPTPEQDRYRAETGWGKQLRLAKEHSLLVGLSLFVAVLLGIPLGIAGSLSRPLGLLFTALTSVVQTIPSMALLCFFIPFLGIGFTPALAALILYSLLPIIKGTQVGLESVPSEIRDNARAIGLSRFHAFRKIHLPMASPHILNGIRLSAVISVGTATLAALIGAGGYGSLILTGLALNDVVVILKGALPASIMAVTINWFFEYVEHALVPEGI